MNDVEKITNAIARTPRQHKATLRKLRFLLSNGAQLASVAAKSPKELAAQLADAAISRNGSTAKNPRQAARDILRRLRLAALEFSDLGLPLPEELDTKHKLKEMPAERRPKQFSDDIAELRSLQKGSRGRERNGLTALKLRTLNSYIKHLGQTLTLAEELGEQMDDDFGIRKLTSAELVTKLLTRLDQVKSRWTVAGYVSPLLRAARELFSGDEAHRSAIENLETELIARIPNPGLSATELLQLDNMAENRLFAAALANIPEAILERSEAPGLGAQDRLARVAAAFAVEVRLRHPTMTVDRIAMFDFSKHLRADGESYQVEVPDALTDGTKWEACSPQTIKIARLHKDLRERSGVKSDLAFPVRKRALRACEAVETAHQTEKHVGAFVIDEVEAVMGMRLGYRKLKTIVIHVAVREFPEETAAIAQAAGLSLAHLERRWSAVLDRRTA